jgi:peptidylprolyl isomerase
VSTILQEKLQIDYRFAKMREYSGHLKRIRTNQEEERMSEAKQGDTVKVHYTGTLGDGTIFDSSNDREPLQFTLGKGQLIKGFEDAVIGMSVGETKSVSIPSDEAYGSCKEELLLKYTKADFPPNVEPKEGLIINLVNQDGRSILATIT